MPTSAAQVSEPAGPVGADRPGLRSGALALAPGAGEQRRLLRVEGESVAGWAPGEDAEPLPERDPAAREANRIAIVPGELVALHWVELPDGLSAAQAAAAAKLMIADVAAEPGDAVHVALGARSEQGATCVALVSADRMSAWLSSLAGQGFDPDLIVPETALIEASGEEIVRFDRAGIAFCRGPAEGFAAEAALAELVLAGRPVRLLSAEALASGLEAALANPLVNLRQGRFARRRLRVERAFLRRIGVTLLALIVVTIATPLVGIYRDTAAARRLGADAHAIAAAALPPGTSVVDPPAQLRQRLAELGGGAGAFSGEAAALFAALRATPSSSLASLSYRDGALSASVKADTVAALAALRGRIETFGFAVAGAPPRSGDGQATATWLVRPQ